MDIKNLRRILTETRRKDYIFLEKALLAERYYRGMNDILDPLKVPKPWLIRTEHDPGNPMRNADNRVACTYYNFLVNQKVVYLLSDPPSFDSGNKDINDLFLEVLGGHWARTVKTLGINASNCSVAWLHSWLDEEGEFHYGVVDSKEIKAIWGGSLDQELIAVLREYYSRDPLTGETYDIVEFWDNEKCYSYRKEMIGGVEDFREHLVYSRFNYETQTEEPTNEYVHGFSKVPFSAFFNNQYHMNDLELIKGYIDTYDKVFSTFSDNLEDVQQTIFVLENMGATNLTEFREQLKREKAVKVIDNDRMHTDLRTLTIEIPTDAASNLLDLARKNIFEQGQGVDPRPDAYAGNTSGEALKYMYANLDMKCGAMKDEFEIGFKHFLTLMLEHLNVNVTPEKVKVLWGVPTRINNVTEAIENTKNSVGIVSERTLLSMHPAVKDIDKELDLLEQEKEESMKDYPQFLTGNGENTDEEEETVDEQ